MLEKFIKKTIDPYKLILVEQDEYEGDYEDDEGGAGGSILTDLERAFPPKKRGSRAKKFTTSYKININDYKSEEEAKKFREEQQRQGLDVEDEREFRFELEFVPSQLKRRPKNLKFKITNLDSIKDVYDREESKTDLKKLFKSDEEIKNIGKKKEREEEEEGGEEVEIKEKGSIDNGVELFNAHFADLHNGRKVTYIKDNTLIIDSDDFDEFDDSDFEEFEVKNISDLKEKVVRLGFQFEPIPLSPSQEKIQLKGFTASDFNKIKSLIDDIEDDKSAVTQEIRNFAHWADYFFLREKREEEDPVVHFKVTSAQRAGRSTRILSNETAKRLGDQRINNDARRVFLTIFKLKEKKDSETFKKILDANPIIAKESFEKFINQIDKLHETGANDSLKTLIATVIDKNISNLSEKNALKLYKILTNPIKMMRQPPNVDKKKMEMWKNSIIPSDSNIKTAWEKAMQGKPKYNPAEQDEQKKKEAEDAIEDVKAQLKSSHGIYFMNWYYKNIPQGQKEVSDSNLSVEELLKREYNVSELPSFKMPKGKRNRYPYLVSLLTEIRKRAYHVMATIRKEAKYADEELVKWIKNFKSRREFKTLLNNVIDHNGFKRKLDKFLESKPTSSGETVDSDNRPTGFHWFKTEWTKPVTTLGNEKASNSILFKQLVSLHRRNYQPIENDIIKEKNENRKKELSENLKRAKELVDRAIKEIASDRTIVWEGDEKKTAKDIGPSLKPGEEQGIDILSNWVDAVDELLHATITTSPLKTDEDVFRYILTNSKKSLDKFKFENPDLFKYIKAGKFDNIVEKTRLQGFKNMKEIFDLLEKVRLIGGEIAKAPSRDEEGEAEYDIPEEIDPNTEKGQNMITMADAYTSKLLEKGYVALLKQAAAHRGLLKMFGGKKPEFSDVESKIGVIDGAWKHIIKELDTKIGLLKIVLQKAPEAIKSPIKTLEKTAEKAGEKIQQSVEKQAGKFKEYYQKRRNESVSLEDFLDSETRFLAEDSVFELLDVYDEMIMLEAALPAENQRKATNIETAKYVAKKALKKVADTDAVQKIGKGTKKAAGFVKEKLAQGKDVFDRILGELTKEREAIIALQNSFDEVVKSFRSNPVKWLQLAVENREKYLNNFYQTANNFASKIKTETQIPKEKPHMKSGEKKWKDYNPEDPKSIGDIMIQNVRNQLIKTIGAQTQRILKEYNDLLESDPYMDINNQKMIAYDAFHDIVIAEITPVIEHYRNKFQMEVKVIKYAAQKIATKISEKMSPIWKKTKEKAGETIEKIGQVEIKGQKVGDVAGKVVSGAKKAAGVAKEVGKGIAKAPAAVGAAADVLRGEFRAQDAEIARRNRKNFFGEIFRKMKARAGIYQ